jgi:type I restriction enzyme R subunit
MSGISEDDLEHVALEWFAELSYEVLDGPDLGPEGSHGERESAEEPILTGRLRMALEHLNPGLPVAAIDEAIQRVKRRDAPTLELNNQAFHQLLTDGVPVELARKGGGSKGVNVRLFDFEDPQANDWLVVRQFDIVDRASGTGQARRLDLVVFCNGIPVAVIELKDPADESADVWKAHQQLQTYKQDVPSLFAYNCVLAASDDVDARVGALTAPASRFLAWRTIDGQELAPASMQPLEVLVRGVFEPKRFLELVRFCTVFVNHRGVLIKKQAAYHQFDAVQAAVEHTLRASAQRGDKKIGVVWHTQGSGKSLTMLFYAGKLVLHPAMENPTIVVLTDRNDLDDQLFTTFLEGEALLRQTPRQADDRDHLQELLRTTAGGVYFTTIQKFFPEEEREKYPLLSERSNIVVIADEAHRSQYGFKARVNRKTGAIVYGYAKYMRDALPNASFVGFTGTPIELADADTRKVFGTDISVYDIQRAVEDKATVPIYYEGRLAKIDLDDAQKPKIDPDFEEVTEDEEEARKEALKAKWSAIEKLAGAEKRIRLVAADLVDHFERRLEAIQGKGLVVCMSREICVDLYDAIIALRPHWHDADDERGQIKIVMTGTPSDKEKLRAHLRSKSRRDRIAERFKDPNDPLKLVIVRDMWLTGFDVPCLHTMYVDKPMRGHTLMQAIARVNRVFGTKPGGLVVDYIGIATFLKDALETYTQSGGTGDPTQQQEKAARLMLEKLDICRDLFHGFDYRGFFSGAPRERLALLPAAREHILSKRAPVTAKKSGKKKTAERDDYERFLETVTVLSQAFALAMPHEDCERVRDEVAFFQAVKAGLVKLARPAPAGAANLDQAIRQIVSNAIVAEDVVDIFGAAGLKKPDLSILSEEFLNDVRGMKYRNLAIELLNRLLRDALRGERRASVVQTRKFSELLEQAILRYRNRTISSAAVLDELIAIARELREANQRGEKLKLSTEEFYFYEVLAENESARTVLGDKTLARMARELTDLVRKNATIDWQLKRSVKAKLRSLVRRVLKKHGYPPDASEKATETVLEQAKQIAEQAPGASECAGEPGAWAEFPESASRAGDTGASSAKVGEYPYPIAFVDALVRSQASGAERVRTRLAGIESALTLLVAGELGLLLRARGKLDQDIKDIVAVDLGKPVAMGTWLEFARRLAALLPSSENHPVARAARALVTPDGKPSALALELQTEAVAFRNKIVHPKSPLRDEAIAARELHMNELWARFKVALAPLTELRLVSLERIIDFGDGEGAFRYSLRDHQGDRETFPLAEVTLEARLKKEWCYFQHDKTEPLLLWPIVSCHFVEEANRYEICLARALAFEQGSKVEALAVPSGASRKIKV